MSKSKDLFSLPAGPAELCFDRNKFMTKTFSVDDFLHEHRNAGSLEGIRDDLGIYLKVLRSAMIELINEDYADFVNLSANLIGLDQSINGILTPLGQLREEIVSVKMSLTDSMNELSECLDYKKQLRIQKKSLQSLSKVQISIHKLDSLLNLSLKEEIKPNLLERAAQELIHLNFHMTFCEKYLKPEQKEQVQSLHKNVLEKAKNYFLLMLSNKDLDGLEKCLRIYYTLDECASAEEIFRKDIVGPIMHNIISETSLQNSIQGLSGVYDQTFDFINLKMTEILSLTQSPGGRVKGFNFFINSYWVEVERRLESHMASIFAPGNPDLFFQKYKSTMEFLSRLENVLKEEDKIQTFRSHTQYKSFQNRWNLPVYFQIRFQEIGGNLETSCCRAINKNLISFTNEVKLLPFITALACTTKCWGDGVYLPQLFHRFWKLTLQILARIACWVDEVLHVNNWNTSDIGIDRIDFLVILLLDVLHIINHIPIILNIVIEKLPIGFNEYLALLEKCLNDSKIEFETKLEKIESEILKELKMASIIYIKQVADIPRLYRKTNKDVPSKPCSYVEQLLGPLKKFSSQYEREITNERLRSYLEKHLSQLTIKYYTAVDEVLTSVQKTEESLRRLKNLRERSSNANSTISDRAGVSDDDKIRLQLHVDVIFWLTEIEKLGINRDYIEKLNELLKLVEDATKTKVEDN